MTARRQSPRVPTDATATVTSGDREVHCKVVDVSARGMAIVTGPSETLERFVHVRTDLGPQASDLDLDAMVVRRELHSDHVVWGLAFEKLPTPLRSRIEAYVSERAKADSGS